MNKHIISEEKINKIVDVANHIMQEASSETEVEKTIVAMLKVTQIFHSEMKREALWSNALDRMVEEADHFYDVTGWKGMEPGKNKISLDDLLIFRVNIQSLLLQTLFACNGANYDVNTQAYDVDAVFDRIFESVPKGKMSDIEIIRFLLLPIYNSIHNTNYDMPELLQTNI